MRNIHRERWKRMREKEPISTKNLKRVKVKPKPVKVQKATKQEEPKEKNAPKMKTLKDFVLSPEKIGKECLRLTNVFRAKHNKPALKWHDGIYKIAMEHSENMGNDKVQFSHAGFNDRVHKMQVLMACSSAAENLAYSSPTVDVAKVIVDGWINSPGHRKNLLSDQHLCSVAPYQNKRGIWYATQLFAKLMGATDACTVM